jgi:thioester reductase-like protein
MTTGACSEPSATANAVLITGAAGFLGSYLALELLERTDAELHLLVRASAEENATARVRKRLLRTLRDSGRDEAAAEQALERFSTRLHVIDADLCDLGARLSHLRRIDQAWHVAALMHFEEERRDEVFATNVAGTRALLDALRDIEISAVNFVSTAYVAGSISGTITEGPARLEVPACNAYEESKREAEQLVVDACAARGIRWRILRPSIIVGDSRTGGVDSDVGLYGMLKLLARLRRTVTKHLPDYFQTNVLKFPASADAAMNLICVDHTARVMVDVALAPDSSGYIHVTSERSIPIEWMMQVGTELFHMPMKAGYSLRDLNPSEYVMVAKMQIFECYLSQPKTFARDTCLRLCPDSIRAASLDDIAYKKLIDAWVREHASELVPRPQPVASEHERSG